MEFLNRNHEIKRLTKAIQSGKSKLIVVYGRRRLGKTRMLQQIMQQHDIYFIADQRESAVQIETFARLIAKQIENFDKAAYPDWESLFISLNKWINKKITIYIDEFPYLVKNAPDLPSVLQKFIDKKEQPNFHLVLCGSSQQMMQKMVIDHNSPLYGRADEIIKTTPMSIYWLKEGLDCSCEEAVEEYAVWGGVPRYWEIRKQEDTLKNAIINQVFDIHGVLHEEPMRLFLDDTRDSVQMHTLISIISSGVHRLSEIASRIGKPATQLNRPLQRLIDLGYVKREIPWGVSKRNAKKTLYKIAEPFIHFYYRFVIPEKTSLELGYNEHIYQHVLKSQFSDYCSETWEELCRQALPNLLNNNVFEPGFRWWGNDINKNPMEIDIVAESRNKKEIIIGEAKWSSTRNIRLVLKELEQKASAFPLGQNKKILKVLFIKEKPKNIPEGFYIFSPEDIVGAYNN
jgi:AAA+ ATPase superfamily predicted ATPase